MRLVLASRENGQQRESMAVCVCSVGSEEMKTDSDRAWSMQREGYGERERTDPV